MFDIASWFALIFLILAGYSAGAVLGSQTSGANKKGDPSPTLLDTITVVVLWIGGIVSRLGGVEAWSVVGMGVVIALAVAFMLNRIQTQSAEGKPLPQ